MSRTTEAFSHVKIGGLNQDARLNAVQLGQVSIKHDALPPYHVDLGGDTFNCSIGTRPCVFRLAIRPLWCSTNSHR